LTRRRVSRRALLRASGRAGVGVAGLALVGCGGDDDEPDDDAPTPDEQADAQAQADADPAAEQAAAQSQSAPDDAAAGEGGEGAQPPPPAEPKPGGVVRLFTTTDNFDRFDPHRSRFRAAQQVFSLTYSRLLRPDSVSAGTLEADLAGPPEQPDETTSVFQINPAAVFWDVPPTDGRAVTSEDVRLSFQRQIDGLNASGEPDLRFYRRELMARAATITASDPATIAFTTDAPDATFVGSVIGGPWSFVVSAEAIDEFAPRWDQFEHELDMTLSSGSGPYVPVQLNGFILSLARSANWWGETPAYLDGVVLARPTNDRLGADYVAAQLDALDFPLNSEQVDILQNAAPDGVRYEYPIDTPVQLSFGARDDPEDPLGDPRLGAAIAHSIDRFALIERLYAGDARPSGPVPWFLGDWALPEERLLEFPGYRPNKDDDLAEIALLVEAAGGAEAIGELRLVVPDLFEGFYPGVGESVAGMVERNAGLTMAPVFRSYAEITEQLEAGVLPSFFGWGPAPLQADPTDGWRDSVAAGGAGNYGGYANAEVDALIDQMGATFDTGARQRLAHQVQELLLTTGFWRQNLTNGIQLGVHHPHFHPDPRLHDFAWSMHHLAGSWIDIEADSYPERELPAVEVDAESE
jgi:ABC-type transport system substrate-binding protein